MLIVWLGEASAAYMFEALDAHRRLKTVEPPPPPRECLFKACRICWSRLPARKQVAALLLLLLLQLPWPAANCNPAPHLCVCLCVTLLSSVSLTSCERNKPSLLY